LNNLGNRLSRLGRREEALLATAEAVDVRRRLAAANPTAFEPALATSLNNLGIRLAELGKHEPALHAAFEAVDIRRRLTAAHRGAHLPDLANSLWNVGHISNLLGQTSDQIIAAAREGLQHFDELAAAEPQTFTGRRDAAAATLAQLERDPTRPVPGPPTPRPASPVESTADGEEQTS
jgi:tetratricopeptide (TPR) repeat protein